MIREKVTWYLKTLPKAWRQAADSADRSRDGVSRSERRFEAEQATRQRARRLRRDGDAPGELADGCALSAPSASGRLCRATSGTRRRCRRHLRVNVCVVDANGRELGSDRDLPALKAKLGEAAQLTFSAAGPEFERTGIKTWDFGDLPESLVVEREGRTLTGYPALVDHGETVSPAALIPRAAADASTRDALLRLLRRQFKDALQRLEKQPPGFAQAALMLKPAIATDALACRRRCRHLRPCLYRRRSAAPIGSRAMPSRSSGARVRLPAVAESAFRLLAAIAAEYHTVPQRIGALAAGAVAASARTCARSAMTLVHPGLLLREHPGPSSRICRGT